MLARSAPIRHFSRGDALRFGAVALVLTAALGTILAIDALPGPFGGGSLVLNGVATVDIRAPRALTYESAAATQEARDQAVSLVQPQYDFNLDRGKLIAQQQLQAFDQTVTPVDTAYSTLTDPAALAQALKAAIPYQIGRASCRERV